MQKPETLTRTTGQHKSRSANGIIGVILSYTLKLIQILFATQFYTKIDGRLCFTLALNTAFHPKYYIYLS